MNGIPGWTCAFYVFVVGVTALPLWFIYQYWDKAQKRNWRFIDIDSRDMYVDGVKTMITASGVAVALLASSAAGPARTSNGLIAFSANVAVICLISCVCSSLMVIFALLRGYESARSRMLEQVPDGTAQQVDLTNTELLWILIPAFFGLTGFLWGFIFLARIAFHF